MDQSGEMEVTATPEEVVVESPRQIEEESTPEQTTEPTEQTVESPEQPAEVITDQAVEKVDQNQNNAADGDEKGETSPTEPVGDAPGEITEAEAVPGEQSADSGETPWTPATPVEGSGELTAEGENQPGQETPGANSAEPGGEAVEGEGVDTEPAETGGGEGGVEDVERVEATPAEGDDLPESDDTATPVGEAGEEPLKSDTFGEGERPESPLAVGQRLSREGSPTEGLYADDSQPEMLEPATPDQVSEVGDEMSPQELMDIVEDEVEPEVDRVQLIERYHASIGERDQLQQQNYQLQHKIAEYFRKKKSDETRQDFDKNVSDQEQRYIKYMANLEELRRQEGQERDSYQAQIEELRDRCMDKQDRVEGERICFADFKKQVAINSLNSRSGKTIPPKDIEQYLSSENRKDNDVVNVRLENIKLKNKLKKKEQQLKSKEELAEGLHLIDFEQLKIENQTYNEKIEERNEELLKLRKKITSTVQVLTHLKEKLQFVQAENQVQNTRLRDVEAIAAQKRDVLSRTKQARDALRIDNQKLRQNCGLLGNEPLLRDFEEQRDESDDLKMKLEKLQMQHAELTLNCNQVRRKIEQARLNQM